MTRKPHHIVWHKKSGKFIPPSVLKPHSAGHAPDVDETPAQTAARKNKLQDFSAKLASQIKKVVDKTK